MNENLKDMLDAYRKIVKAIDSLESIGLQVEPNKDEKNVGHLLYGAADDIRNVYGRISQMPESRVDEMFEEITKPQSRQLYEVDDGNGSIFYIRTPASIKPEHLNNWLKCIANPMCYLSLTPVERITEGFSYHLFMHHMTDDEWDIYLPLNFEGTTDNDIYNWFKEYFTTPADYEYVI